MEGFNYSPLFREETDLNNEQARRNIDSQVIPNKFISNVSIVKHTTPNGPIFDENFEEKMNPNGRAKSNEAPKEEEPSFFKKYVSYNLY